MALTCLVSSSKQTVTMTIILLESLFMELTAMIIVVMRFVIMITRFLYALIANIYYTPTFLMRGIYSIPCH